MRVILFTGKGGVGKTSVAAATGVGCAERGLRTLVVSTDAAHSLSDSVDMTLGADPTPIAPNLFGLEVNVQEELRRHWGEIRDFIIRRVRKWGALDEAQAEEFAIFPGMEELFSLLRIKHHHEAGDFDAVIVDCAPTGATVRMLSLPEVAHWYMERVFNIERKAMHVIRPLVNRLTELEVPPDSVFGNVRDLYERLDGMKRILSDPESASVRLVMNPEKMVICESRRAYAYLNLFGFPVDAAIVNRVLPGGEETGFLGEWRAVQAKYLGEIGDSFGFMPILRAAQRGGEVHGLDALRALAREVYGDRDPAGIFVAGRPVAIARRDGKYELSLSLPFVEKKDIGIWVHGRDLTVQLPHCRRNLYLPGAVAGRAVEEARFEGDRLRIIFEGGSNGGPGD